MTSWSRPPVTGPRRVLQASQPLHLYDAASSKAIEKAALNARPSGELMARAGASVARLALALRPGARRIWIAAGPGGNGGDGLHAAAELASRGIHCVVSWDSGLRALPEAREGADRARGAGATFTESEPEGHFDLCIDALLGLGSRRGPDSGIARRIEALRRLGAPVLAIDLPTGLCPDTGAWLGGAHVDADWTLSLLTLKPGLFTGAGRQSSGDIWFDDLGVEAPPSLEPRAATIGPEVFGGVRAPRGHLQHKGSYGDVLVLGGAPGMMGALRLAAGAAQRAGAGRTLACPLDPEAPLQDPTHPEWLWQRPSGSGWQQRLSASTVVCGMGGGADVATVLPEVLSRSARLVLDADGLNALATDPTLMALLERRGRRGQPSVLTPHPLEAARLLGSDTASVQRDRLAAAATLSERFNACVVLKGSGTVVASPGQRPAINVTGHAGLATGGTGDVLAGWLGGLWAQAAGAIAPVEPLEPPTDAPAPSVFSQEARTAFRVACAAVWLHGRAVDDPPGRPVVAGDLAARMTEAAAA